MPDVSVVIPLFGRHRSAESLRTVCDAWLDQDVRCEVIVAVTGVPSVVPGEERDGALRIIRADIDAPAPGLLRNIAARHARAPMLYLSDADVLPIGTGFLRGVMALAEGRVVAQPWMYRLAGRWGPLDGRTWRPRGTGRFCFVEAAPDGTLRPCGGERFDHDGDDLMVIPPSRLSPHRGPAELLWRPPFHWGGLLLERRLFTEVGGYCPRYVGWGCEDDDLLVKLAARREIVRAWRAATDLACLHFEHPRPYDTAEFAANQAVLSERTSSGITAMIKEDVHAGEHGVP